MMMIASIHDLWGGKGRNQVLRVFSLVDGAMKSRQLFLKNFQGKLGVEF